MNDVKEVVFSEWIKKYFGILKLNSRKVIDKVTKVTEKEDAMRTNYMMTVDDVIEELGVKRSKAYSILKQLNDEQAKERKKEVQALEQKKESLTAENEGLTAQIAEVRADIRLLK